MNLSCEPPPVEVRKVTYPALNSLLDQAEARIERAGDDDTWLKHWLIWLELHRLAYGPEGLNIGSEWD